MRKSFIKGFSVAGVVGALLLATPLLFTTSKASAIIEEARQTSSSTTFNQTESAVMPLPADQDIDDYITEQRTAWFAAGVGQNPQTSWDAFSGYDEATNTYHHPIWLGTYFVGVSVSETCGGSGDNAILIGDVDYIMGGSNIDSGCVTYHYEIRYRMVTITFPDPAEIDPEQPVTEEPGPEVVSTEDTSVVQAVAQVATKEEPTSTVTAPDTGAFTTSSSATQTISGAFALVSLTTLGFLFIKRNR